MKQIRTIIQPTEDVDIYDKKVNKLLSEGWELTDRQIISIKGEPNEVGSATTRNAFYAEFEKEVCYFEEITN